MPNSFTKIFRKCSCGKIKQGRNRELGRRKEEGGKRKEERGGYEFPPVRKQGIMKRVPGAHDPYLNKLFAFSSKYNIPSLLLLPFFRTVERKATSNENYKPQTTNHKPL
jgi:hypothetical protein